MECEELKERIIKGIDNRLELNKLRRDIFYEAVEAKEGVGKEVLVAKEMLDYENRWLNEFKQTIEIVPC